MYLTQLKTTQLGSTGLEITLSQAEFHGEL
jgi:hypothetical protein